MNWKNIAACASALALFVCGCGNGDSAVGGASSGLATSPRVCDGAIVAAGFDKTSLDRVVDAALGEKKAEMIAEARESMGSDVRKIIEKAGLENAEINWAAVSLFEVKLDEDGDIAGAPPLVVALAFDHDFDKLAAAVREAAPEDEKDKIKDATVLGEKALSVNDNGVTLTMTSLAGKILVIATTDDAAAKGVALYRDGKGGKAFSMDGGQILRLAGYALGQNVVPLLPAEALDLSESGIENGPAILKGLGDLNASISATQDNGIALNATLATAKAEDAQALATAVNSGLDMVKAMFAMGAAQDPAAKPIADALNAATITAEGAKIVAKFALSGEALKTLAEKNL